MKKLLHIILLLAVLAVSCHKGPERIPRGEMEDIMHDVILQDQFLKQHSEIKKMADTTLVYEGIFEQYGYTTDDFLFSLAYYLEDPARMEKVMEKVEARFTKESKVVKAEVQQENWRQSFMRLYQLGLTNQHLLPKVGGKKEELFVDFHRDSLVYAPKKKES